MQCAFVPMLSSWLSFDSIKEVKTKLASSKLDALSANNSLNDKMIENWFSDCQPE